jgi:hypothetical protein
VLALSLCQTWQEQGALGRQERARLPPSVDDGGRGLVEGPLPPALDELLDRWRSKRWMLLGTDECWVSSV